VKPAMLNLPTVRSTVHRARAALAFLLLAAVAAPGAAAAGMGRGFNQLLEAVVRIDVRELNLEGGARRFESSIGSGVLLSQDGLVLTNAHVASPRAVEITITLASLERVGARLVGWDHWTDLALLRLDMAEVRRRHLKLAYAQFGDSSRLFAGETVYAVGTPFGLTRTVTRGIISNPNRYFEDDNGVNGYETGAFNTWLQTDAAINPGNSGGPLVTEDGRIVGITSRGYLGANNLGFAIPSNVCRAIAAGLVRDGSITRSYIGIVPKALQDFESFYALALDTGMLVDSVDPGSPAARAGIAGGDVLLAINGAKVDGRFPEQLPPVQNMIASQPVGSTLILTVKRADRITDLRVVTQRLESSVGEEAVLEAWGLSVRKVSRAYARICQLPDDTGVLVIGIQQGFPADVAGLQAGDIVTKINQAPLDSLEAARAAHAAYSAKPVPTLFEVMRDRRISLFILKP
jgi:serine protease Do